MLTGLPFSLMSLLQLNAAVQQAEFLGDQGQEHQNPGHGSTKAGSQFPVAHKSVSGRRNNLCIG